MSKEKQEEISLQERIMRFFKETVLAIYPDAYPRFSQKRYLEGVKHFMLVTALSLLITSVILILVLPSYSNNVGKELDKFDKLEIDVEMGLNENVTYKDLLKISETGNYSGEKIHITNDMVTIESSACFMFKPGCWFTEPSEINAGELSNVLEHKENLKGVLKTLLYAILPALAVGITVFVATKAVVFVFVLYLLTLLVTKIGKLRLSARPRLLICIYASTVFLLLEPVFMLLGGLRWLHVLAVILLAVIGVALVGEKKQRF